MIPDHFPLVACSWKGFPQKQVAAHASSNMIDEPWRNRSPERSSIISSAFLHQSIRIGILYPAMDAKSIVSEF